MFLLLLERRIRAELAALGRSRSILLETPPGLLRLRPVALLLNRAEGAALVTAGVGRSLRADLGKVHT